MTYEVRASLCDASFTKHHTDSYHARRSDTLCIWGVKRSSRTGNSIWRRSHASFELKQAIYINLQFDLWILEIGEGELVLHSNESVGMRIGYHGVHAGGLYLQQGAETSSCLRARQHNTGERLLRARDLCHMCCNEQSTDELKISTVFRLHSSIR